MPTVPSKELIGFGKDGQRRKRGDVKISWGEEGWKDILGSACFYRSGTPNVKAG